jgi:short-subunit dehydrogenase
VWVNNAAVTAFGSFVDTPASDIRRVLDVNVMGYVHGAQEALRQFRTQGSGTLINVASIVGGLSQPYAHAYVMSKHAVRALTCSIRQELCLTGDRGIRVCAVLPSTVDTPLFQHAANRTGRAVVAMPPVYRPEQVANAVLRAVRHPRREVVVGTSGRLMMAQWRWAPALTERMLARQVDRTHLSDEPAPDSPGNLYFSADRLGAVHGGWHGQRRTAMRQVILAAAAVGVVSASIVGYRRRT